MKIIELTQLEVHHRLQLMKLWNQEYPMAILHKSLESFEDYLSKLEDPIHRILQAETGEIVGWYFDFMRDGERNFGMMLDSKIQGVGFGTALLNQAKEGNTELCGWAVDTTTFKKADGSIYSSPIDFYRKNGFEIIPKSNFKTAQLTTVKIRWSP